MTLKHPMKLDLPLTPLGINKVCVYKYNPICSFFTRLLFHKVVKRHDCIFMMLTRLLLHDMEVVNYLFFTKFVKNCPVNKKSKYGIMTAGNFTISTYFMTALKINSSKCFDKTTIFPKNFPPCDMGTLI